MNSSDTHSSTGTAADSVDDDAMRWYLALRESQGVAGQAELRRRFQRWLEQSARHRAAYDACARDWARLDPLREHFRGQAHAGAAHRPRRGRIRAWGWSVAFAAILAAAGVAWQMHSYADFAPLGPRQFATSLQDQSVLAMRDGTRVALDVGTTLQVEFSDSQRQVSLPSGTAFFDVAPDAQRPFVIHTGAGQVRVLGTAFEVQRLPDGLRVGVARGHVRVIPPGQGRPVDLRQGQSVRLRQAVFDGVQAADPQQLAAWRQGRLVFDRDTLGDVGQAISRRGEWTVHVAPSVRALPVTLAVQLDDVVAMLRALPDVLPVEVAQSGRVVTISAASDK
ncbi:FecR family protein [Bordetella petrii]|uniref:FecR family protein n=1 Tax=Bordetella petrii TaxID=94624 RepID=UPI001E63F587|nr:FecR domain-containing protein [Bordetella petrii]MCD0505260.1 FecR domain-containing protein [Bordetella petrii]